MSGLRDYRVELLRYAPFTASPAEAPIDITDRTLLDGFGAINRAAERDLLSFKTGDLTVTFRDHDGFLEDLFAHFGPADRWQLRVYRRGAIQFWGVVLGQGSVIFGRTEKTCEITAYGLTRQLNDVTAESLQRTFAVMSVSGAHTAGQTTLTLNTTADLLPRDELHLRRAAASNNEDVVARYIISATQIALSAGFANDYVSGDPVTIETPYYRYRTVEFHVTELFSAAGIESPDIRLSREHFTVAAPAPISGGGLGQTQEIVSPAAWRNDRAYVVLGTTGTYYQPTDRPDADWAQEDSTLRPWMDWSRYRKQVDGAPNILLRFPDAIPAASGDDEWLCGVDDRDSATKYVTRIASVAAAWQLQRNSTTDGTTWTGWVSFGAAGPALGVIDDRQVEFDPIRDHYYAFTVVAGNPDLRLYDVGAGTWTQIVPGTVVFPRGFRYIPELDYVLASYEASDGTRHFVGFRNGALIFDRAPDLPRYIRRGQGGDPTVMAQSARWVNGRVYIPCSFDGAIAWMYSSDDWRTATIKKVIPGSIFVSNTELHGSRVGDAYYFFPRGSSAFADRAFHVAAPFYAGVVNYADFEGLSIAEDLKRLSVLTNAVFWVDDAGGGHFVSRDLLDIGEIREIAALIKDRSDDAIWDQTAQYVEVSGSDSEAVSGEPDFAASGLSIDSDLVPNEAFAQALADSYAEFYSRKRAEVEVTVQDTDGHIYQPLDRVTIDSIRYMVYESDHDLPNDEVRLTLLEDV